MLKVIVFLLYKKPHDPFNLPLISHSTQTTGFMWPPTPVHVHCKWQRVQKSDIWKKKKKQCQMHSSHFVFTLGLKSTIRPCFQQLWWGWAPSVRFRHRSEVYQIRASFVQIEYQMNVSILSVSPKDRANTMNYWLRWLTRGWGRRGSKPK